MTKGELLDLIRLGEGLTLEFKRSVPADLGREVCAFANAIGGRIVIGVDDHGKLVGVSDPNRTKSEIQSIARNVDPPIAVEIETIENLSRKPIGEPIGPGSSKGSPRSSPLTRERVLSLIAANPHITSEAIASSFRITKRAVLKHVRRRKDAGLLRRIGPARGGHWKVERPSS